MNNDDRVDYSWLIYLPDNYVNSGRLFGGMLSISTVKELVIILGAMYLLTRVFLEPVVSSALLWAIRIGFGVFVVSINLLIRIAFNSTTIEFIISLYEYFKLTKKYRYERRDAAYERRKETSNS